MTLTCLTCGAVSDDGLWQHKCDCVKNYDHGNHCTFDHDCLTKHLKPTCDQGHDEFCSFFGHVVQREKKVSISPSLPTINEMEEFCLCDNWIDLVQKYQKVVREPIATHMKCKCGSNKIQIDTKQVRSGDEGQSCFCSCQSCGAMWRIE